ncbi:MAG: lipoyl(octanoyl) transferase LipB [Lautropia sp.]
MTAYLDTLERMRAFTRERQADPGAVDDELWLTEHPPIFTLGFASRREHLHEAGGIPVVQTERGGQVTYHGPGQILAYPLLDLRRRRLGARELVCRLETGMIECLAGCGIAAIRRPGAPGIYVGRTSAATTERPAGKPVKIGSIGLKISRGFTWHGLSLNCNMDLSPFTRIDPCGYEGLEMTDVFKEAGTHFNTNLNDLGDRLACELVAAIER